MINIAHPEDMKVKYIIAHEWCERGYEFADTYDEALKIANQHTSHHCCEVYVSRVLMEHRACPDDNYMED